MAEQKTKKAPAKKAAAKKTTAKKVTAKKAAVKKVAVKAAKKVTAKKAPAKKAAVKKVAVKATKKVTAKKVAAKTPKKAESGYYVVRTAQKVADSLPAPLAGYNEGIMRTVTTGMDFVEELSKNAMASVTGYVDLGKKKATERSAVLTGTLKKVTDTCTVTALEYNEKYVKKAITSGKKTLETGTDLVEDMGMVALETVGTMAESGKKLVSKLPMVDKMESTIANGVAYAGTLAARKEVQAVTTRIKSLSAKVRTFTAR